MREVSRGHIELASADPFDHPIIDPNFLSNEQDVKDLRAAVRLTREIVEQPAFDGLSLPALFHLREARRSSLLCCG
jgi:choline dehydrogenase